MILSFSPSIERLLCIAHILHDSHVDYKSVGVIMRRDATQRASQISPARVKRRFRRSRRRRTSTPYTRSHARRCVSPRLPPRSCLCFDSLRFLPFSILRPLPYSASSILLFVSIQSSTAYRAFQFYSRQNMRKLRIDCKSAVIYLIEKSRKL